MRKRIKNAYFWLGLIGIVFAAGGVNIENLTNWKLLLEAILSILNNPVAVLSVTFAVLGVFVDTSTPGVKDTETLELE